MTPAAIADALASYGLSVGDVDLVAKKAREGHQDPIAAVVVRLGIPSDLATAVIRRDR